MIWKKVHVVNTTLNIFEKYEIILTNPRSGMMIILQDLKRMEGE